MPKIKIIIKKLTYLLSKVLFYILLFILFDLIIFHFLPLSFKEKLYVNRAHRIKSFEHQKPTRDFIDSKRLKT